MLRPKYRDLHHALRLLYTDCSCPACQAYRLTTPEGDTEVIPPPTLTAIERAFNRAVRRVHQLKGYKADDLADRNVRPLIEATFRALSAPLAEVEQQIPEAMMRALRQNVWQFSGFRTHHQLTEISMMLIDEQTGGYKSWSAFRKSVEAVYDIYNRNYLRAEYSHAVAATQMAARWVEFERDADRYDLQYRTAQDDRVRADHAALHSTTLPPSDPFWDKYLPPLGWNCRCTTVQVLRGRYPRTDPKLAMMRGDHATENAHQQIFRYNPGKDLKIFPPRHPYLPKGCGACSKRLKAGFDPSKASCQVCGAIGTRDAATVEKELNKRPQTEWVRSHISPHGNGAVVTNRERIKEIKETKAERAKARKELRQCRVLADNGYFVEYLRGKHRSQGQTYDITMNGIKADLKVITGKGKHIVEYAKKAFNEQGGEAVVFELPNKKPMYYDKIAEARRKTTGRIFFYFAEEKVLFEAK